MNKTATAGSSYAPLGPVEQWDAVRQRRVALERVVQSAQAVEYLRRGLRAALLLKGTPRQIAEQAGDWPLRAEHAVRVQPSRDLLRRLEQLDRQVRGQAERILTFAHGEEELLAAFGALDETGRVEVEQVLKLLAGFRRDAEMAVTLRLLLRERGVAVHPLRLALPPAETRERVARLRARERLCRRQVYQHVQALRQDLERLLVNDGLATAARHSVGVACQGLEDDLEHLQRGGSVDHLPVPLDVVELDQPAPLASLGQASEPAAARPRRPALWRRLWQRLRRHGAPR